MIGKELMTSKELKDKLNNSKLDGWWKWAYAVSGQGSYAAIVELKNDCEQDGRIL